MTEKQSDALARIMAALPEDCRALYREVADCAISLGYMPAIRGTRGDYLDFVKSKVHRTLLKINTDPKFPPCMAMKFYALPTLSAFFQSAVEERLRTWERLGYAARCFGCGRCDGTEGYRVTLPDGETGFLCGYGVLPLPPVRAANVAEIQAALEAQDAFFMRQASR